MRRVVITGLGAITPLGAGIQSTWRRLLASESGLVSLAHRSLQDLKWNGLPSTVAGIVPVPPADGSHSRFKTDELWRADDYFKASEQRRMSTFAQYAVAATDMALKDAGWKPTRQEELDATGVCLGSGIGNLHDMYETSVDFERDVCSFPIPMDRTTAECNL